MDGFVSHQAYGAPVIETVPEVPADATTLKQWGELRRKACNYMTPSNAPHRYLAEADQAGNGRAPHVVKLQRQGRVVALVIGWRVRAPMQCRIGYLRLPSPHLDYFAVVHGGILTDGSAFADHAMTEHLSGLLVSGQIDAVHFSYLRSDAKGDSSLSTQLARRFRECAGPLQTRWRARLLDEATGQPVKRHSSKTLATLRRKDRRLAQYLGGVAVSVASRPDEVDAFLSAASSIAARTYHGALDAGLRHSALWRSILSAEARAGRLRGSVMTTRGHPVAYALGLVENGTYYSEAMGYDPQFRHLSPGSVLLNRVLNALAKENVHVVDFGFGDADYKQFHGTEVLYEQSKYYLGSGVRPQVSGAMFTIASSASSVASRCLKSMGVFDAIKRRWRRRLESGRVTTESRQGDEPHGS